jgi:hypothetical protein
MNIPVSVLKLLEHDIKKKKLDTCPQTIEKKQKNSQYQNQPFRYQLIK